ncbi:MAG: hypothetical protein A2722_03685 [Candidatus Doudnabacteria bacterium RIFCSPHIGHO2_01_FULL_50_11]|uniref:Uncharacterized protein n=1 Tax=Candidatus Doudnabacteria bacterium RIFCSPHIGHO2_01_FULL_50_11 TaxID=1817828 RepID=A0A1F5PLW3_9BACT|nr:MAG: hypothetical protein A2722_03685 [Candidatus Doudnabacteria bacterium RIFCSPHIGHO2_01_FULL_50_11]
MILTIYKHRIGEDLAAERLLRRLCGQGLDSLTNVRIEHVLRLEGENLTNAGRLEELFGNTVIERCTKRSLLSLTKNLIVEICYKRAITDPEMDSILHAAQAISVTGLKWARLATRYQFVGVSRPEANRIASQYLCNPQVQTIVTDEWATLMPQGIPGAVEMIDLTGMDLAALRMLSEDRRLFMPEAQLMAMQKFFRNVEYRPSRDAEVEMSAARWSDHCSHTTWKALGLLQRLQEATATINHPLVISAYVDNSGVMRFYDGWAINVKGETHIHPSFAVYTYGGIKTKHGGVIRDIIFTGQGAYPIAGTTIMGICDPHIPWGQVPSGAFHPLTVLRESIRGTHDYTNPMGIPMAWSQYLVDGRNWKGFALGHSIGILPESRATKGVPQPGDFVVLIGGATGIDGIHGATASSGSMTEKTSVRDAASVQIGMPIEERNFMEAIPILRDADCIHACTDCGAAGLSSAVGEMAEECGVWVNLAWVPLKCASMRPWEIWLSESQERGVLAVPMDKLTLALSLLETYGVPAAIIGVFTSSARCQVVHDPCLNHDTWLSEPNASLSGQVAVDLPYTFLKSDCPLPQIEVLRPASPKAASRPSVPDTETRWVEVIRQVLGHFNVCDQSAAAHRYDQTVQGNTVLTYVGGLDERMPDELFVTAPVPNKPYGVGIANAANQFYGDVSPAGLGKLMLAGAAAKLVAAGFAPSDITCCANVYTPPVLKDSGNAWRLRDLVENGYAPASIELGVPVISGKDSSSGRFENTTTGEHIDAPLTLDILTVGRIPHVSRLVYKPFQRPDDYIYLYHPGYDDFRLDGSVFYDYYDQRGIRLPNPNLPEMRQGWQRYHKWVQAGLITSRSAIAEAGLIRRIFEMTLGSGLGCQLYVYEKAILQWLFGELQGAIVFCSNKLLRDSQCEGSNLELIGAVSEKPGLSVFAGQNILFRCLPQDLASQWSTTFSEVLQ